MKYPKICQRKRRGRTTYYCEIGGHQRGLGTNFERAKQKFAELLEKHCARKGMALPPDTPLKVRSVLLAYLEHCKQHKSQATYRFNANAIAGLAKNPKTFVSFDDYMIRENISEMVVTEFGPEVVYDWIDKHFSGVGSTYRHNLMRPIKAAFNWAKANRRDWRRQLADDPLAGLKMPTPKPRDAYISSEQWAKIEAASERELLDILSFLRESGCRPQEARVAEAKHFDREGRRLFFPTPVKVTRGEQRPRSILLNVRAFEIAQRLAIKHPSGPLFRNKDGEPWTRNALNHSCNRIRDKLSLPSLQPYAFRHTFCTDALMRGVDPLTIAELMGHANGLMVMKVYQNLGKCMDHLHAALAKATND